VAELLQVASRGPDRGPSRSSGGPDASPRDRTVAARTRATSQRTWPAPPSASGELPGELLGEPGQHDPDPDDDAPVAEVIPLGIFDPYQEATKRW
jgi:putative transposase